MSCIQIQKCMFKRSFYCRILLITPKVVDEFLLNFRSVGCHSNKLCADPDHDPDPRFLRNFMEKELNSVFLGEIERGINCLGGGLRFLSASGYVVTST